MNSGIEITRRCFIKTGSAGLLSIPWLFKSINGNDGVKLKDKIKPINGTWYSIQYPDLRFKYINPYMVGFSCADYGIKIFEMAELGMEYLVLNAVTLHNKAFYNSSVFPRWELECNNPIEAILKAADKWNMKVFLTCEYPYDEDDSILDSSMMRTRLRVMGELVEQFSNHKSFFGWYFAREAYLNPNFQQDFITYINTLADEARKLTPELKILIAPYGTRFGIFDDTYVRQLEKLPVDIIAFQDELGCAHSGVTTETITRQFEMARKAHDKNGRVALWADVETFTWERESNHRESALVPAAFPRILDQLRAVSPFVDNILVFTAQGIIEKPESPVPIGHADAFRLYRQYKEFLDRTEKTELLIRSIRGHSPHQAVGKQVKLLHRPSQRYANGDLTDGYTPSSNYLDKGWLGFYKQGLDAILDMGKEFRIHKLAVQFLQYRKAGIDLPHQVRFDISNDGAEFSTVSKVHPEFWINTEFDCWIEIVVSTELNITGRYIRVRADCPWEWLFVGEVLVNPDT
jgi:hypothetical protein